MAHTIRLLIADDHPIVRAGLRSIIESDPTLRVISEVGSVEEVLTEVQEHKPDVLLLDLALPNKSGDKSPSANGGLELIRLLHKRDPDTRIIVVSMSNRSPIPERAVDLGAQGYLAKDGALDELLDAIHAVHKGERYYSASIEALHGESAPSSPSTLLSRLTRRELEVFMHLAAGESPVQIGQKMALSHKTVHAHRASILKKLGLKSNTDLVRFGISAGLVFT